MPQHAHSSGFLLYAARRTRLKALTNDMSAVRGEILTWTSLTASYVCSVAANYKQACFVSGPPRTAPRFAGHLALQSVFALSGGGVTSRANGKKKKKKRQRERERERKSSAPSSMPVYRDIHQRLYPHLKTKAHILVTNSTIYSSHTLVAHSLVLDSSCQITLL